MALPDVNPEYATFTVWRYRPDVKRWVKVSHKPTFDEAKQRRDEEIQASAKRQIFRITHDVTTRLPVA